MPIRKQYEDQFEIGGTPAANLTLAASALQQAGFKNVRTDERLRRVTGDWKPFIGTLHGDLTVSFAESGLNTAVRMLAICAVDNAFAVGRSPGRKIFDLFLQEFMPRTSSVVAAPTPAAAGPDVASQLQTLADLSQQGLLTPDEYAAAKQRLLAQP